MRTTYEIVLPPENRFCAGGMRWRREGCRVCCWCVGAIESKSISLDEQSSTDSCSVHEAFTAMRRGETTSEGCLWGVCRLRAVIEVADGLGIIGPHLAKGEFYLMRWVDVVKQNTGGPINGLFATGWIDIG